MAGLHDAILLDQAGREWRLRDQRDAATLLITFRGDW